MTDKIRQARRAVFEKWWSAEMNLQMMDLFRCGDGYQCHETNRGWMAFNAALDCVVIELGRAEWMPVSAFRSAIESTNLGIKVK